MNIRRAISLLGVSACLLHADESTVGKLNRGTPTPIQSAILATVPDNWKITKSPSVIILTLSNARFLNSINLPLAPEEKLWADYAWTADFMIEVRFAPALSQSEYDVLVEARETLRKARVAKAPFYGGQLRREIDYFVESAIPLPLCQIGSDSVWISCNDRSGSHWVRPEEAKELERKLVALLATQGREYKPTQQAAPSGGEKPQN